MIYWRGQRLEADVALCYPETEAHPCRSASNGGLFRMRNGIELRYPGDRPAGVGYDLPAVLFAPKGHNRIAQGAALGLIADYATSPERAAQETKCRSYGTPSGLSASPALPPRASP